jgi:phospholipid-binding lipoprotein MlaA
VKAKGPQIGAVRTLAFAGVIVVCALAGTAHAAFKKTVVKANPTAAARTLDVEDPYEGMNRTFYGIHEVIDHAILRPLALGYSHSVFTPVRKVLHNFVTELGEPMVFANDVLQLRAKRAATTFGRFVINASIGVGGLFDPATPIGLQHHENGFGTTLGRYGIKPGPYIFLPLMGPSNFRDIIGAGLDIYLDPLGRLHYHSRGAVLAGVALVRGVDTRAEAEADLQQIESMGTDSYATLRSLYMQQREAEIRGEKPVGVEDLPDFDSDTPPAAAPNPAPAPSAAAPTGQAPAASDPGVAKPSAATVQAAPDDAGPDAIYFLTPPAPPPSARPSAGPPLHL